MRITVVPPATPPSAAPSDDREGATLPQDRHDVDLAVRAQDATWGDLATVLVAPSPAAAPPGGRIAHVVVDGDAHQVDEPFDATLVQPGSVVSFAAGHGGPPLPASRRDRPVLDPAVHLRVVGGLDAGLTRTLGTGAVVLGRDPSCDVVLASPTVSRRHAVIDVTPEGAARVTDLAATNGVRLAGTFVVGSAPLPTTALTLGATCLQVSPSREPNSPVTPAPPPRRHNRPPRLRGTTPVVPLRVPPEPRAVARRTPFSWAMVLTPVLVGVLMARLFSPLFAVFALLSPVLLLASWFEQRRRGSREQVRLGRDHRAELARFATQVEAAARSQGTRLCAQVPDLAEVGERAMRADPRLWERRPDHADFGELRLGRATRPWAPELDADPARLTTEVAQVLHQHGVLHDAPLPARVGPSRVIGLAGPAAATVALARSLVIQAAVLHGPADLWLAVCGPAVHAPRWAFVSWLPHHRVAPRAARLRICTTDTERRALADELRHLDAPASAGGSGGAFGLCVIDGSEGAVTDAAQIALIEALTGHHSAIVLAPDTDALPAGCTTVVECHDEHGTATVVEPPAGTTLSGVLLDGLGGEQSLAVARRLTAVEDPDLRGGAERVPATVSLRALLDASEPGQSDDAAHAVLSQWRRHRDGRGLAVPLGARAGGSHMVDLVADGPHALVGGTTGAGKSELLRSWVIALACTYAPRDVTFVLVDYKGGSAFDACATLPHVVGLVTDLDDRLGERALRSLRAELQAREQRLRDAGASDYVALRATAGVAPLPRLVVIIDEFATLVADLPGFVDALVGIAQRGRSLGVHLVLATQRPHGAISDNIRTNTNLRIALRMLDAVDSVDVIGTRDASTIDRHRPGRAFSTVGGEPPVEWQAAHVEDEQESAARTSPLSHGPAGAPARPRPFEVVPLDAYGRRIEPPRDARPAPAADGPRRAGDEPSEVDRVVASIDTAFARSGWTAPDRPWLPPLAMLLPMASLRPAGPPRCGLGDHGGGGSRSSSRQSITRLPPVPLGMTDEPDRQRQRVWHWDPTAGPLAVYGMPGTGKTGVALAAVDGLAHACSADECHFYVIGSAMPRLAALADHPHVGAVLTPDEQDRIRRLLRWLDERRQAGAADGGRLPAVVVVVDGAAALLHALDDGEGRRLLATFLRLASEGPAVGIHLVVTADRPQAMPGAVAAATDAKVVLRLPDPYDYSLLGLRRAHAVDIPGRGVLADGTEIQIGHVDTPAAPRLRNAGHTSRPPRRIDALPTRVRLQDLPEASATPGAPTGVGGATGAAGGAPGAIGAARAGTWVLPLGIEVDRLEPCLLELQPSDHLLLAGPPGSGRSTALLSLGCAFEYASLGHVVVVAPRASVLTEAYPHHVRSADALFARLARLAPCPGGTPARVLVLIDDADVLDDARLQRLAGTTDPAIRIAAAGRADRLRRELTHWTRPLRSARHGVALDATAASDGDLWGVRLASGATEVAVPGRAACIRDGRVQVVQVATP